MLLLEKDKKSSLELLTRNRTTLWGLFELISTSHGIPHAKIVVKISIPLIAILMIDGMAENYCPLNHLRCRSFKDSTSRARV